MSFKKLIPRRNGIRFVECDFKAFADNDSSKFSRQATQDTEEFDWETLDDNTKIDWDDFMNTLRKIPALKHGGLARLPPEFRSGCLLHDAITLGAPEDVLMFICERFPETLRQEDGNGRVPVHVACSNGCSPEFISHCINYFPQSVSATDNEGKNAVHHLCQSYVSRKHAMSNATLKTMKQILWMLFRKAPGSIVAEDNQGVDAIELALESNLGMSFIGTLQDMTSRYHENEARKAAQRRCMKTRRQLDRKHSPHAAFAA